MLIEPLDAPVLLPREEMFVVRRRIDGAAAAAAARRSVVEGFTRPVDIDEATTMETPVLAWVPFWRVEGGAEGFWINMPRESSDLHSGRRGHVTGPITIHARRPMPFDVSVAIELGDMIPAASAPDDGGEIIGANVSRSMAEEHASARYTERDDVLVSSLKARLRRVDFVWFPIFHVGYAYRGVVRKSASVERYHVVVSGRDARIVGSSHPSKIRSLAHRIRRLVTF